MINAKKSFSNARTAKNMTLQEIAEQLGVSRQAVAGWESGVSRPTLENFRSLQKILELEGTWEDWYMPRKRLRYTQHDVCSYPGCTLPAIAKTYCRPHYEAHWRSVHRKGKKRC